MNSPAKSSHSLDEREFELINIIGAEIAFNQRSLSRHMNLSLGMINMLVRRLIEKGHIRITQLNKRKVEYILTPKGFAEKMEKSVKYTLKTLNSIGLIKDRLKVIVRQLHDNGARHFKILGRSDLAVLVESTLKEVCRDDYQMTAIDEIPDESNGSVILICRENEDVQIPKNATNCVDLVLELSKDYVKPTN